MGLRLGRLTRLGRRLNRGCFTKTWFRRLFLTCGTEFALYRSPVCTAVVMHGKVFRRSFRGTCASVLSSTLASFVKRSVVAIDIFVCLNVVLSGSWCALGEWVEDACVCFALRDSRLRAVTPPPSMATTSERACFIDVHPRFRHVFPPPPTCLLYDIYIYDIYVYIYIYEYL